MAIVAQSFEIDYDALRSSAIKLAVRSSRLSTTSTTQNDCKTDWRSVQFVMDRPALNGVSKRHRQRASSSPVAVVAKRISQYT